MAVIAGNFASTDPDVSTRGTVGEWADVCVDGTRCPDFSCGTDPDGPELPRPKCGDKSTGQYSLLSCRDGYVMFSDPAACVEVSAGSMLNRLPSGVLDRYAFVCPYGTFSLNAGAGNSSSYSGTCQKCPAKALCVGGANAPQCERGTYSIGSGQGLASFPLPAQLEPFCP